jgi:hypothetical protein
LDVDSVDDGRRHVQKSLSQLGYDAMTKWLLSLYLYIFYYNLFQWVFQ